MWHKSLSVNLQNIRVQVCTSDLACVARILTDLTKSSCRRYVQVSCKILQENGFQILQENDIRFLKVFCKTCRAGLHGVALGQTSIIHVAIYHLQVVPNLYAEVHCSSWTSCTTCWIANV